MLSFIFSMLYEPREFLLTDGGDGPIPKSSIDSRMFRSLIENLLLPAQSVWWSSTKTRPEAGRFGLKLEGAGKVRVFAIPSPILQRLVKPLHDWTMSVLKELETDGTFDQLAPLRRLKGPAKVLRFTRGQPLGFY
ncbi:Unknown protein [Striga hermonthica]|uniref:Uncharacterized protein n=1 Tax=Striga hermonthica TaxID=68872 RepID=A0A9N7R2G2_STRHE|nr:Unknown protein [Striga hermonthica]